MTRPRRASRRRLVAALGRQDGQTSTEYLGVLVVVAAVVAALVLAGPGIGEAVSGGISRAICTISGGECAGGQERAALPARVRTLGPPPESIETDGSDDDGAGVLDGARRLAGTVGDGAGAFLDGLVAGDANREGYEDPTSEGLRGAGQFVSGLLVVGDVRDAAVAGERIVTDGEGWSDLGLAVFGVVPIAGDAAKGAKGIKGVVDTANRAGDAARTARRADGAPQALAGTSDDIAVIGRQPDTAVAKDWSEHEVLDIENWTIAKNDAWVRSVVDRRMRVYVGSPETRANLQDVVNDRSTVFGRELQQFLDAGYTRSGDYLLPPGG